MVLEHTMIFTFLSSPKEIVAGSRAEFSRVRVPSLDPGPLEPFFQIDGRKPTFTLLLNRARA
jgi:hypothetical protein